MKKIYKRAVALLLLLVIMMTDISPVYAASYKKTTNLITSSWTSSLQGTISFKMKVPAKTTVKYEIFHPVHDNTHRGANNYSDTAVRKDYKITGSISNNTRKAKEYTVTKEVYHYTNYSIFGYYNKKNKTMYQVKENVNVNSPSSQTWYSEWYKWDKKSYQNYKKTKTIKTITYIVGNVALDVGLAFTGAGLAKAPKTVKISSNVAKFAVALAGWVKSGGSYAKGIRDALKGDGYKCIKSYMQQGQSTRLKFNRLSNGKIKVYIQGKDSEGKITEKMVKTISLQEDIIIRMTPSDIVAFDVN